MMGRLCSSLACFSDRSTHFILIIFCTRDHCRSVRQRLWQDSTCLSLSCSLPLSCFYPWYISPRSHPDVFHTLLSAQTCSSSCWKWRQDLEWIACPSIFVLLVKCSVSREFGFLLQLTACEILAKILWNHEGISDLSRLLHPTAVQYQ